MAGSIYPSYPPLLSGAAELLGTGVACVAGGAATGAGPSQPHHLAHYQRLLEMQKGNYFQIILIREMYLPAGRRYIFQVL